MQPFGVLFGFFIAPQVIQKIGNNKSCLYFGSIFISTFILIPIAETFFFLAAVLFISGLVCAGAEVSMNSFAAQMEKDLKIRMMSRFHAFWSIGALISGGLVTLMSVLKVSFFVQQCLIIPILLILVIIAARSLPSYGVLNKETNSKPLSRFIPPLSLIILCIMPFGALLLEGALMEWTAVFKRDYQDLPQMTVGIIFCSFALTMTLFRFYGDQIIDRFGINKTIMLSIGFSFFGMLIYAQNNTPALSIIGAGLVGAGIANIYPITMTLAASLSDTKEKNVATVAFVSFTSFLIGAPLIGFMGEYLGLEVALSLIAPTSLFPLLYLLHSKRKN
jgi:MFS family permease